MDDTILAPVDTTLATIAAERDRIAGELHDDPIQMMTAVSLHLQRIAGRVEDEALAELVELARSCTDDAIDRLRHMLFVLHPSTLETDGLCVTFETYLETYLEPIGIEWRLDCDLGRDIPTGLGALAFRLGRDAIGNAMAHAEASVISVEVDIVDDHLCIQVRDDGIGFDVGSTVRKAGHLGITHAAALAASALGTHSVASEAGRGTTVTARLPIIDHG